MKSSWKKYCEGWCPILIACALVIAGALVLRSIPEVYASGMVGLWTVPNGGTGLKTLTANGVIIGNGTSPPTFTTDSNTAHALCGGSPPSFGTSCTGGVATSITVGTTTVNSGVNGDCLYDNAGVLGNQACSGGGSFTPVTSLHGTGNRSSGMVGGQAMTNFASGNIAVAVCDGEGSTASEPTFTDTASTVYTKASSGLIGGAHNISMFVGALAGAAPTGTCNWPTGASFTGIGIIELPVSLVQNSIDVAGSNRNCCTGTVPISSITLTTTVSDIVISAIGFNSSGDTATCGPNMTQALRTIGQDAAVVCLGVMPQAVTNTPVSMNVVSNGTNAAQAIALKHQ